MYVLKKNYVFDLHTCSLYITFILDKNNNYTLKITQGITYMQCQPSRLYAMLYRAAEGLSYQCGEAYIYIYKD